MRFSERLYRILIRAYPRRYREHFAESMACCFRDQLRAAATPVALTRLWLRTLADLAWSVPARHLDGRARVHLGHSEIGEQVRMSVFFARQEASSFSRSEITVEHLLLGLLRNDAELAARLGPQAVAAIVQSIEHAETSARRVPPMEDLRLSRESRCAWFYALVDAGGQPVEPRHLLRGILARPGTLAARLLREQGIEPR
jgi:hypothetical protein